MSRQLTAHILPVTWALIHAGWTIGVQIPTGPRDKCILQNVHDGAAAHPDHILSVTGVVYHGVERPERKADHSPPSYAEVKNEGKSPSSPFTPLTLP
jgi:hypothetical protein